MCQWLVFKHVFPFKLLFICFKKIKMVRQSWHFCCNKTFPRSAWQTLSVPSKFLHNRPLNWSHFETGINYKQTPKMSSINAKSTAERERTKKRSSGKSEINCSPGCFFFVHVWTARKSKMRNIYQGGIHTHRMEKKRVAMFKGLKKNDDGCGNVQHKLLLLVQ